MKGAKAGNSIVVDVLGRMIQRLLNILYDFSPSPNAGAGEQKVWTKDEKVRKFKRDLKVLLSWRLVNKSGGSK